MARVHIVCFGNLLQGDDGLGIHVFQRLRGHPWPADVACFDAGLSGLGALAHFEGCERVIVVDALEFRGHEGQVHRFGLDAVDAPVHGFSAHELDVTHLVHVLPILFEGRQAPEVTLIGAEIRAPDGTFCMGLSPNLSQAVGDVVREVLCEVERSTAS